MNLSVDIGGIKLKNPLLTASGTFGYGEEYSDLIDLDQLGAIITKGITLKPTVGNPPPRLIETSCGLLNAIGLENPGVEVFIKEKLPYLRQFDTPVIVNIAGEKVNDYVKLAGRLNEVEGIAGLEINISCPNVNSGKQNLLFAQDARWTYEIINKVRKEITLPLIAKLSPDVTDITKIAQAAEEGGANALSLSNTFLGLAINIETKEPKLANFTGGLSGPAIKPLALRIVWETAQTVHLPIIGMGGIMEVDDALEFIIAGATAVALGTVNFVKPKAALEIISGLEKYLIKHKINDLRELRGTLRRRK